MDDSSQLDADTQHILSEARLVGLFWRQLRDMGCPDATALELTREWMLANVQPTDE